MQEHEIDVTVTITIPVQAITEDTARVKACGACEELLDGLDWHLHKAIPKEIN